MSNAHTEALTTVERLRAELNRVEIRRAQLRTERDAAMVVIREHEEALKWADRMAHQMPMDAIRDRYWEARGGTTACTVCNGKDHA
jgi:hypothetical protein